MSVRWSQDEVEFLFDKCGIVPNKAIADRLGRSPHAIRQKLSRNGTSIFDNIYTARMLARELGVCHKTVMRWYRLGYIKGKVAGFGRGYLKPPMVFLEKDIVVFLKDKRHLFDLRKVTNLYFRNVIKECYEQRTTIEGV